MSLAWIASFLLGVKEEKFGFLCVVLLEKRVFGEGKWKADGEVESSCDSIAETAK
jgi:hypothetical protein